MFSKYPLLPTVIVGNKVDLERKLPFEEIEATVCLDWECGYAECSALTGSGVEGVFMELLKQARGLLKVAECSAPPLSSSIPKDGASSLKRHSLVRRIFSRENLDESPLRHRRDSCKIS